MKSAHDHINCEALFTPLKLGHLRLKNRVVMAPMTREAARGGVPTPEMRAYYRRRAAGGAGLIITEGAPPDLTGSFGSTVPRFYGADALTQWGHIVREVKQTGCAIFAQLWHVGAFEPSLIGMTNTHVPGPTRQSPSGLAAPALELGRKMNKADIDAAINAFSIAALEARNLGFDGVEIHAAHGYLPDQFFWKFTNSRKDRFGGSLANRARFAAEVVTGCRATCGPAFPISLRFSQWKQLDYDARIARSPDELETLLAPLVRAGVSVFHVSTRRFWEPGFAASQKTLAGWTRIVTGLPVIAVGSVGLDKDFKSAEGKTLADPLRHSIELAASKIAQSEFDLIAVGRAMLANADWARIVQAGEFEALKPFEKRALDTLD